MQDWDDQEFCEKYDSTWEISVDDTHYGWLAPGENSLGLLDDLDLANANVLDIGCGLGQNLITLENKGATCYGLDISACMLSKAETIISRANKSSKIKLANEDMRDFSCFPDISFDVILSIYSMEYLSGVRELRSVIHYVYNRLKHGGVFIMCFSHPSQAQRYPEFMNHSIPLGTGNYKTFNWSYKDATNALFQSKFSIERIVEQRSINPSKLSYEDSLEFPYHFRRGKNPCMTEFDEFSNLNPHTVIYKSRKQSNPIDGMPKPLKTRQSFRVLWGFKRKIINTEWFNYLNSSFIAQTLSPRDNIIGIVDVVKFVVTKNDIDNSNKKIELKVSDASNVFSFKANSIQGLIHSKLKALNFRLRYKSSMLENEENKEEIRIFLSEIDGLTTIVKSLFNTDVVGMLVFVNGHEPSEGALPLDVLNPIVGDEIIVSYLGYKDKKDNNPQKLLF